MRQVLAKTPPELAGDILTEGILMTGGTAQLRGLAEMIEDATGIRTRVAYDPVSCVGIGTGKCFELIGELKEGFELASGGRS